MDEMPKIFNVAIVAHIDHGKTTLIDSLLKASDTFRENEEIPERVMDSMDIERERGITIFAKQTGLIYKGNKINLVDTPGHSDFSGEVERILGMVSGVLILVDAQEGPMPQTRFVISKALQKNLQPIVVLNKIDRMHANPSNALNLTFDLFIELGATDEQLDFQHLYASGINGYVIENLEDERISMDPLFQTIIKNIPTIKYDKNDKFLMQATTLNYDEFLGYQASGKIISGDIKKGDTIRCISKNKSSSHKVKLVQNYLGLEKHELSLGIAGEIVSISGVNEIEIGDTICNPEISEPLPRIEFGEPTISVEISTNDSPLSGIDGKHFTISKIHQRLIKESHTNPSLSIDTIPGREDTINISGRGEMQIAIVIISMIRDEFECSISKPKVIFKKEDDNNLEPYENIHIEVPEAFSGKVIEEISRRKGQLLSLSTSNGMNKINFEIPLRGIMGYRAQFLTQTKGEGMLTSSFSKYDALKHGIPKRQTGSIISSTKGKSTAYAIFNLQNRGIFFIEPGTEVYEGMVIGEHSKPNDIVVNVTKSKHLTNVRAAGSDEHLVLSPIRKITLESAIGFISDDELVEVTPKNLRIRKKLLKEGERKREQKLQ